MKSRELITDGDPRFPEADQDPDARELEAAPESDEPFEAEEEKVLVAEHVSDAIKLYLRDIRSTKLLTAQEERELALKIDSGDKAARDRMITCNLRLVVQIAKRYLNRGLPYLDLIEEGNLGLIRAVGRFDISKGFRFSTYATWWIRQGVERALMNQASTVRLPVHIAEDISKLNRATNRFCRKMNREPSLPEIAEIMGVELSHVRKLMVLKMKTYSLDQPVGEFSDFQLGDLLEDDAAVSPVDQYESQNAFQLVSRLIETFSDTEKEVLTLRFGLSDNTPQTLDSIGKSFGLSRERIRQIEFASLTKLRKLMDSHAGPMVCC